MDPEQAPQKIPQRKSSAGIIIVIIIIILIAVFAFAHKPATMNSTEYGDDTTIPTNDDMNDMTAPATTSPAPVPDSTTSSAPTATTKSFTVSGANYSFTPSTLTVNKGDTVKITFVNSGGMHDLVVDGYNVQTPIIQSGASASVTFVADKTGTFDYYCSVGNHRQMGMQGVLTVQ